MQTKPTATKEMTLKELAEWLKQLTIAGYWSRQERDEWVKRLEAPSLESERLADLKTRLDINIIGAEELLKRGMGNKRTNKTILRVLKGIRDGGPIVVKSIKVIKITEPASRAAPKDKLWVVVSKDREFLGLRHAPNAGRDQFDAIAEGYWGSIYSEPVGYYVDTESFIFHDPRTGKKFNLEGKELVEIDSGVTPP